MDAFPLLLSFELEASQVVYLT